MKFQNNNYDFVIRKHALILCMYITYDFFYIPIN
jgi:hypothetical protein